MPSAQGYTDGEINSRNLIWECVKHLGRYELGLLTVQFFKAQNFLGY